MARLTLVTGIMVAAFWAWGDAEPAATFWATVMFLTAFAVTAVSAWHTVNISLAAGKGTSSSLIFPMRAY